MRKMNNNYKKNLGNKEESMLYYKHFKLKMNGKQNQEFYPRLFNYYKIIKKINNNF